jgi:uncharacterized membrane protein
MKKFLLIANIVLWLFLVIGLFTYFVFVRSAHGQDNCSGCHITAKQIR